MDELPEEQVVDDGGQPEPGAGSLLALVEDQAGLRVPRQVGLDPLRRRVLMRQGDERCSFHALRRSASFIRRHEATFSSPGTDSD
jgi:hypothetical protein